MELINKEELIKEIAKLNPREEEIYIVKRIGKIINSLPTNNEEVKNEKK